MKIALAQMEVKPAQPEKNLETMLEMIEQAKKQKVDVVAFPEMCLGGYLIGDKFLDDDFCADLMEYNEDLAKASVGITLSMEIFMLTKTSTHAGKTTQFIPIRMAEPVNIMQHTSITTVNQSSEQITIISFHRGYSIKRFCQITGFLMMSATFFQLKTLQLMQV